MTTVDEPALLAEAREHLRRAQPPSARSPTREAERAASRPYRAMVERAARRRRRHEQVGRAHEPPVTPRPPLSVLADRAAARRALAGRQEAGRLRRDRRRGVPLRRGPHRGPAAPACPQPDLVNTAWRDYGNRVGAFRLLERLERAGIPPTILLNTDVYDAAPAVTDRGPRRPARRSSATGARTRTRSPASTPNRARVPRARSPRGSRPRRALAPAAGRARG